MSAALAIAGLVIFALLGVGHLVFTLQSKPHGGPMMPTNPDVLAAMSTPSGLGMAPGLDTTLFRAWIGFNLSHAVGIIAIATTLLWQVIEDIGTAVDETWFLIIAGAVPLIYLTLAILYWFDKPRDGIAIGSLLLWAGIVVELV